MSESLETALASIAVPWRQRQGSALVEAYSLKLNGWTLVAEAKDTPEWKGKDVAALIVSAVNGNQQNEVVITELVGALESCLECEDGKLDWSAEHDAECALYMAGEVRKADKGSKAKKP